jgi:hypothetical protein
VAFLRGYPCRRNEFSAAGNVNFSGCAWGCASGCLPGGGISLDALTQASHMRAVKGWFRWLARQNYLLHNPASAIN